MRQEVNVENPNGLKRKVESRQGLNINWLCSGMHKSTTLRNSLLKETSTAGWLEGGRIQKMARQAWATQRQNSITTLMTRDPMDMTPEHIDENNTENLSRTLEDSGTVTSVLIP